MMNQDIQCLNFRATKKVKNVKSNVFCSLVNIDKKWNEEIKKFDFDIYHLSDWLNCSKEIDKGEPKGLIIRIENRTLLFPLIIRKVDNIFWDATSTYGYGGPLGDNLLNKYEIDELLYAALEFLKEKNFISWFIRLHPILNKNWESSFGVIVDHGPTLSSDLTKTEEEHWAETQNRHKRGIKKALKESIVVKVERLTKENVILFSKIYTETMKHLNASEFYFFDEAYFLKLSEKLSDKIVIIIAYDKLKPIAASLYTHCKESKIMQYHLGGTLNDYRALQPAKLITHTARAWGRENGYKFLHLGGGVGASLDSLYEYKKGFSSNEHLFRTHRIIINQSKYTELVPDELESTDSKGFFPLYRKP